MSRRKRTLRFRILSILAIAVLCWAANVILPNQTFRLKGRFYSILPVEE